MSNWTHVAGIARVDALRLLPGREVDFEKVFGRELASYDDRDDWDEYDAHPELFLPCGSEGSLRMSVWVNPNRNHYAAYTVSLFGDLRDYDDPEGVVEWFREKCAGMDVRNACIEAYDEAGRRARWTFEQELGV